MVEIEGGISIFAVLREVTISVQMKLKEFFFRFIPIHCFR